MKISHLDVIADFEYLETIQELDDQVEFMSAIHDLMKTPTKAMVIREYSSLIRQWFYDEYPDIGGATGRVLEIKERYLA